MSQRLSEKFLPWIESEVETQDRGDGLTWEYGIVFTPNGIAPAMLIQMPAPVLGQVIGFQAVFGKGMLTTEEEVRQVIAEGIESLRSNRSQMLQEEPIPSARVNGSGLHLP